jgi:hypothetical protein
MEEVGGKWRMESDTIFVRLCVYVCTGAWICILILISLGLNCFLALQTGPACLTGLTGDASEILSQLAGVYPYLPQSTMYAPSKASVQTQEPIARFPSYRKPVNLRNARITIYDDEIELVENLLLTDLLFETLSFGDSMKQQRRTYTFLAAEV